MTHFKYIGKIGEEGARHLAHYMRAAVKNGEKDLYLGISSPGGSTEAGFALYNLVESLQANVTTYSLGHIDSAAVPMFLAGTNRIMAPISSLMIHRPVQKLPPASEYTASLLHFLATELTYQENRIKDILAARTKLTELDITRFLESGKRFTPEEAVTYGIVHKEELFSPPHGVETHVVGE